MEMKDLKKFAKEVGIKDADVKKMDEDTLVREVITRVEPQQEYSKELVAFYNDLPDSFFDKAEATEISTTADAESNGDGYPIADVIEALKDYTKVADMKELLADADVAVMFEGFDPKPYKLAPKLKKAMIDFLENPPTAEVEAANDENAEIIVAITELESEEDLVAAFEELQESHFSEIDVESIEDETQLKAAMLAALGYEAKEQKEPEKKKSLLGLKKKDPVKGKAKITAKTNGDDEFDWFDPKGDVEEMYAQAETLGIAKAKKFAKAKLGLSLKIGLKKDEIFDAIATKFQEMAEGSVETSTETGETELTLELVADAVKAKDKETLAAMCDQLEIKLNALQKKSIPGMEKKLNEKLGESESKSKITAKKGTQTKLKLGAKKEEVSEEKSVYQIMEELVIAGKAEAAITTAVSTYYKEKGKSILFIKKRVKTMIGIIKIDNDIEE